MLAGDEILRSWDALDPGVLLRHGPIAEQFLQISVSNFREAARYVSELPYGRNSNAADPLIVLKERRGTCSTKHALLRRLAIEQKADVSLILGIYEMNARNTPGIGAVLEQHNLVSLPEAHCFLRANENRIDVTHSMDSVKPEAGIHFLYEEEIEPDQAGAYKQNLHQRFLRRWMEESGASAAGTFEELWAIRERCIAALAVMRRSAT